MGVDHGYEYIGKIRGGIQWYILESKNFISKVTFELKYENGRIVSFNGQSVTFRLSIKEFQFSYPKMSKFLKRSRYIFNKLNLKKKPI